MRFWDSEISQSWKWAESLVAIDQALCFCCENCSKPNILNHPQRTFPREEGQRLASLTTKPLGAVSQELERKLRHKSEHIGGDAHLRHTMAAMTACCHGAHWGSWAGNAIRRLVGGCAGSQSTGGSKQINPAGACSSLQHFTWSHLLRRCDLPRDRPRAPILLHSSSSCVSVWALCYSETSVCRSGGCEGCSPLY